MTNEFLNDASFFLQRASKVIISKKEIEKGGVIEGILFFALGMERVLKAILFNLNPVYVYKSQEFKNSIYLLYKDHLLPNFQKNKEIARSPDADVLTFKLSLLRAKAISETTEKHTSLLFSLSSYRDIIVHNNLSFLNIDKARTLLLRDFYPLISDYCKELKLPLNFFTGPVKSELVSITSEHQESIGEKIRIKLESHLQRWKEHKKESGFLEKMQEKTISIYETSKTKDSLIELIECPACNNDSLLYFELDFDYPDTTPVGIFVSELRCLFCKLIIEDYEEIDYLKLDSILMDMEYEH